MIVIVATIAVAVAVERYASWRRSRPIEVSIIDNPSQLDDLHLELLELDHQSWVRQYAPDRSSGGYNLVLFRRRVPLIIDMNGRMVHHWPKVRATGRVRLNRDGSLVVIGADNLIKEYTWDGELSWHFQIPDGSHLPHHDVIRLRNGNYLILVHDAQSLADYLLEINRSRQVVWEWRLQDHTGAFPNWDPTSSDPSHANSIQELPPNRWHQEGDDRFRPGNILVSARTLNTIFVIDRTNGTVVWKYSEGLDGQHEALMLDRGRRGAGFIMVFNNGLDNLYAHRRSKVEVIDPSSGESVWEYGSKFFFSSVGGTAHPLPGNSVLVTSSHGGRVFEVRGRNRIVWEWVPPYLPMRVERFPYDHCPQLEALGSPVEIAVAPKDRRPFVDIDLYAFDFRWQTQRRTIDGRVIRLISSISGCRDLRIPVGATLRTDFGIDRERLGDRSVRARFLLTIDDHENQQKTLVDETLDETSDPAYLRQTQKLAGYGLREVSMCIDTIVTGEAAATEGIVYWSNPMIQSRAERARRAARSRQLSEQEQRLREQQLKALGYVD